MHCYKQKSIEEITALFAHEVKNPVSLIKANIELLELDNDFGIYHKNISVIKKELNKITQIVSDFISLFKPIDKMNLKDVSLLDVLREVVDDFSVSMRKEKINFTISCLCNLDETFILADYSKFYILFLNIYNNAVEAVDRYGNINTTIYTEASNIIIDITDDGIGIKDNIKNLVGDPFFTSKPNGSGLGISICKSIVSEFNGRFEIFNNQERGCTARVTFKV